MIARLNNKVKEKIKIDLIIDNRKKIVAVRNKEDELVKLLDSDNILEVIERFQKIINANKEYLSLPDDERLKIYEIVPSTTILDTQREFIYDISIMYTIINELDKKQKNKEIIKSNELVFIDNESYKDYIKKLNDLKSAYIVENNKIIKDKKSIDRIKKKILLIQEIIIKLLIEDFKTMINNNLEKNNIDYRFHILKTDQKEIFDEYIGLINVPKSTNIKIDEDKTINITKDKLIEAEAVNNLYNFIIKECNLFNEEQIKGRGAK